MQVEIQHYDFRNDAKYTNISETSKLDDCMRRIAKNEGYISCDISKKAIVADGGNYMANLYEVDVKGNTADGYKETAIFIKSMTPESVMELVSLPSIFKTELFVYKELSKIFNELQDEGNVPNEERYNTVKYYEEYLDEAIIMENVTRKGFKTWYRMNIVTLEMAEKCIIHLAKLHGLSFVMEQRRPEYFNEKIKTLKTAHRFEKAWDQFVEKFSTEIGLQCLDPDLRSKIEKKIPGILKKIQQYYTDKSIMYCLCHGDYRPNNIMTKEVDDKVTELIPVDYQLVYYGCPIIDFLYFIYISTDRQFRRAHMANLKNLYYKSLDQFLHYFDMSAESALPRKAFEQIYEDTLDYGLIVTLLICPFIFVSEDADIPDVTKEDIVHIDFKIDGRYKERLTDAVEEFIELGYL